MPNKDLALPCVSSPRLDDGTIVGDYLHVRLISGAAGGTFAVRTVIGRMATTPDADVETRDMVLLDEGTARELFNMLGVWLHKR